MSSAAAAGAAPADDAGARAAGLIGMLADERAVIREIAESRIAALGTSAAPGLASALETLDDRDAQVRLEGAFRRVALPFLQAWRLSVSDAAGPGPPAPDAPAARDPAAELLALGAPAWPLLHRTARCGNRIVARAAERVLADAAERLAAMPDQRTFERLRYFLSPLLARRGDAAAGDLLREHLSRTLADARTGTARVRARAEEELCFLGTPAEEFLSDPARTPELGAAERDALLRSVKWCLFPDLRIRTGMSMDGWERLSWRERHERVPLWKRIAGEDAVPLLMRVMAEEPEDIVKLSAVVALIEIGAIDGAAAPAGVPPPVALRVLLLEVWDLRRKSEFGRALDLLDMLVRELPGDREVRVEFGITLRHAKRFDDALREFRTALGLSGPRPKEAAVGYQLALTLLQAGRHEEAIVEFTRYLGTAAGDTALARALWYDLACAYALSGRPAEAIDALLASIEKGFRDREHLVRNDPDLESLRQLPEFRRVVDALDRAAAADGGGAK
ncbi:MAG TPA: hypothetical protein DCM87_11395 [Planctomycetes bacterium]|nr:hypothetical protein [Planctomycetota bacterium]